MSPMNPRLLRPKASGAPVFTTKGYSRVWGLTTKSSGNVTGTASSDTGLYAVKWWDGTTTVHADGDTFSKAAAGNQRAFEIYPARQTGTALLLNFNGSNGSTTFTDSSPNGLTVTAHGGAAISTAQSKFGGASGYFDGSGDYATVSGLLDYGSGDFSIELWVRPNSISGVQVVWSLWSSGGDNKLQLYFVDGDVRVNLEATLLSGGTVSGGEWAHIALCREGSAARLFVNGQQVAFASSTANLNSTSNFIIAANDLSFGGANWFGGYIDDLHIVKGQALYTANFTPPAGPASALPVSTYPSGQFDGFDISNNALTKVRSEGVSLGSTAAVPGGWSGKNYIPGTPASYEGGTITNNLLPAAAIDQFYTDLDSGTGHLFVAGNPGIVADTPTIATAKGYTVFGSVPPSTSLLMNFNGTNGSTTFTDSSPNGLTATAASGAAISTAQSKFGGASGYFDGSGDYIEVASSDGQDFGTGDFTIEMWLRCESAPTYLVVSGEGPNGDPQNFRTSGWNVRRFGGSLQLERFDGQNEAIVTFGEWSPPNHEWIHLAISRQSGTSRAFVDGTLLSAQADSVSWSRVDNTEALLVGHAIDGNGPSFFAGYIDELRIVKGIALYTANFTPPTSQLGVYP